MLGERVRILEGEPALEVADDCSVCGTDVTQYYPRSRAGKDMHKGEDNMARRRGRGMGQIIPISPDLMGTIKTAGTAAVSVVVNRQIATGIFGMMDKANTAISKPAPSVYTRAFLESGLGIVGGGIIARGMKSTGLGVAWALGPLVMAASNIATQLIDGNGNGNGTQTVGPGVVDATPVTGLHANMPYIPPGVAIPYHPDAAAARFRHIANRAA
mgnify:CR=1 FL=1